MSQRRYIFIDNTLLTKRQVVLETGRLAINSPAMRPITENSLPHLSDLSHREGHTHILRGNKRQTTFLHASLLKTIGYSRNKR